MQIILPEHLEQRAVDLIRKSDYLSGQINHWRAELECCFKYNDFSDLELIRQHINKRQAERMKFETLLDEILDVIPAAHILTLFQ